MLPLIMSLLGGMNSNLPTCITHVRIDFGRHGKPIVRCHVEAVNDSLVRRMFQCAL